uniref:F-box associated beta-propeller type 1 domain-containing protein n=1 Tax=Fagus sylvatica TaxID=28930 RepID=A0A2N9HXS5_FAGSY
MTRISRLQIPISHARIVGLYNGMYLCLHNYLDHVIYLWNRSIRKVKFLAAPHFTDILALVAIGLAYHSQNNDFKILRIVCFRELKPPRPWAVAEVYTLSTDSWRRVVILLESEPNIGSIDYINASPCLFSNGALHSIAHSGSQKFILCFDVNDEIFRRILLPQNYLDEIVSLSLESLAVFKGLLALFVFDKNLDGNMEICHIWVMREYGVVESWTKKSIPIDLVRGFFCCTDSGELLIDTFDRGVISYDPESLHENNLGIQTHNLKIQSPPWLTYTADLMESLVLLD